MGYDISAYDEAWYGRAVAVGDVIGDGYAEIVISSKIYIEVYEGPIESGDDWTWAEPMIKIGARYSSYASKFLAVVLADVNGDGAISALDSLLVINRLAAADGATSIPVEMDDRGPNFYDVNGDRRISAPDALAVINELSRINSGSQVGSEGEVVPPPSDTTADALLLIDTQPSAPVEDLSASEKIVGSLSIEAVSDDVVDLLAGVREEDDEQDSNEALDAVFADLL